MTTDDIYDIPPEIVPEDFSSKNRRKRQQQQNQQQGQNNNQNQQKTQQQGQQNKGNNQNNNNQQNNNNKQDHQGTAKAEGFFETVLNRASSKLDNNLKPNTFDKILEDTAASDDIADIRHAYAGKESSRYKAESAKNRTSELKSNLNNNSLRRRESKLSYKADQAEQKYNKYREAGGKLNYLLKELESTADTLATAGDTLDSINRAKGEGKLKVDRKSGDTKITSSTSGTTPTLYEALRGTDNRVLKDTANVVGSYGAVRGITRSLGSLISDVANRDEKAKIESEYQTRLANAKKADAARVKAGKKAKYEQKVTKSRDKTDSKLKDIDDKFLKDLGSNVSTARDRLVSTSTLAKRGVSKLIHPDKGITMEEARAIAEARAKVNRLTGSNDNNDRLIAGEEGAKGDREKALTDEAKAIYVIENNDALYAKKKDLEKKKSKAKNFSVGDERIMNKDNRPTDKTIADLDLYPDTPSRSDVSTEEQRLQERFCREFNEDSSYDDQLEEFTAQMRSRGLL